MDQSVTVVIPCYNAARFLRQTLESVLNQTHAPLEVLVIDDGSTDESAAIAQSYGPPVRVICQPNQGESVARNRGIEEARGDWIAYLDADDLWLPEKLERQLAAVQPGVSCIHTNFRPFGTNNHVRDVSQIPAGKRYALERLFPGKIAHPPFDLDRAEIAARTLPHLDAICRRHDLFRGGLPAGKGRAGEGLSHGGPLPLRFADAPRGHRRAMAPGLRGMAAGTRHTSTPNRLSLLRQQMLDRLVHQTLKAHYKHHDRQFGLLRNYLARYRRRPRGAAVAGRQDPSPLVLYAPSRPGKTAGPVAGVWTRDRADDRPASLSFHAEPSVRKFSRRGVRRFHTSPKREAR